MVEPQSNIRFAGRAKIAEPGEKIDAGEFTLEDLMAKLDAVPSNKRLLRQIGVRESVMRVRARQRGHLCKPCCAAADFSQLHARSHRLASCAQCLSAKARHLAQYEMEDPRVLAVVHTLLPGTVVEQLKHPDQLKEQWKQEVLGTRYDPDVS